jgi:hypothetical protein
MSDQGDAGAWRPATSQNDQHNEPDETTGPLPKISDDEAGRTGFPPVPGSSASDPSPSWAAADDDAPTGGFPAATPAEEPPPSYSFPSSRSPFEPAERADGRGEPAAEKEDPGSNGVTPKFGTEVPNPRPVERSFGSFDDPPAGEEPSFGSSSYGEPSSRTSSFDTGSFNTSNTDFSNTDFSNTDFSNTGSSGSGASPFGSGSSGSSSSFGSFGSSGLDERPGESAPSYGRETFSGEAAEPPRTTPADDSSGYALPRAERRPTAEDEAAEADFFASDDHPPMWDKVVAPSGPPPKPGKPSSGNLRLPDWMRDENAAAGGGPASGGTGGVITNYEDEGKSRRGLFIGVGILVAGLVAVAGVYLLKGHGDSDASNAAAPTSSTPPAAKSPSQPAEQSGSPRKTLPHFKGVHTKATGRLADVRSGLSYARFAAPWAAATAKSPMAELGFSRSQFAVTEKAGGQPKHWARLMSTQLSGAAKDAYSGPGSEQAAAVEAAKVYEARMFNFRHKRRVLANQPLAVNGHKGWLVSDYLTYRRPGVKATGDILAVAVVATGKTAPGVLVMTVPNTNKKLWPDVDFAVRSLRTG